MFLMRIILNMHIIKSVHLCINIMILYTFFIVKETYREAFLRVHFNFILTLIFGFIPKFNLTYVNLNSLHITVVNDIENINCFKIFIKH